MNGLKKYHPTATVYTGSQELFNAFDGLKNSKGTAMIKPIIDPDGKPTIGKQVLDDPDWDNQGLTYIDGVDVRDLLIEIPYCYWETEDEEL